MLLRYPWISRVILCGQSRRVAPSPVFLVHGAAAAAAEEQKLKKKKINVSMYHMG